MRSANLSSPSSSKLRPTEQDELLNPCDGKSHAALAAFTLLAAVYLLTFGPVTWEVAPWAGVWTYAVALVSTVVLGVAGARIFRAGRVDSSGYFLAVASTVLGLVILAPAVVHWAALAAQPAYQSVNVSGVSVGGWIPQHWHFTIFYLLFPVLLPGLYLLIDSLRLDLAVRIIAFCFALSVGVQYYQGLVDWSFLNNWLPGSGRTGGLATDPNAYQLITFLLAPLLISLALFDRQRVWAFLTGLVAMLAIGGLVFAGGRTATGGVLLLLVLSPLILAIAMRHWSGRVRWFLGLMPFAVLIAGAFFAVGLTDEIKTLGLLGRRITDSVERVSGGGIRGLLFDREFRGFAWQMGWLLLWRAPLAGWGAGGFLREYQNEAYRQTGDFPSWVDYVGNHYLMIPIDLGIPALVVQLVIVFMALFVGFKALGRLEDQRSRLALAVMLAAQLVFLLMIVVAPPYFPDAIYAWTLSLALLFVIARRVGVLVNGFGRRSHIWFKVAIGVLGVLVLTAAIGSYPVTFGSQGYHARLDAKGSPLRYERNCYGIEKQGERRWRWCGKNARIKLPLPASGADEIVLKLIAGNPDLKQNPLIVRYGGLSGPTHELTLADSAAAEIDVPLDPSQVVELSKVGDKGVERFAVLSLDVSRTWVPKEWGVSVDPRELGVLVQFPRGTSDSAR